MDSEFIVRRAHRTLKHLVQYRSLMNMPVSSLPDNLESAIADAEHEKIIGIYENYPGQSEESILITSLGLYVNEGGNYLAIKYREISKILPPEDKESETLVIHTKAGPRIIHIRGRSGKFMDVFEFMHFLQRVTEAEFGTDSPPGRAAGG